jgi:glycerophosphoryl diester phosphodiesterase
LKTVYHLDKTIELHKLYFGKIPYLPIWISNKMEFGSLKNLDFVSEISFMYLFATKHTIANIHKHNKKANVWTVDNEERIKQLANIGIDGVITNHPELEVFK